MTAKLFIDGDERELHYVDMDYNRITSFIGWPVSEIFGGLIHLRFTPRGDEDFFLNWMFTQRDLEYPRCLYTFKNGEIVFYEGDVTEDIFFKYRFADCILISYKETFSNQWGMETEMVLSPAIQYYNHKSKYPFLKRWNESYIPPSEQTPYQAMEHEPEIDLKFIARFKRMDSYKGEFGFDWMRDDYINICEDYEELKKEYDPTTIHGEEYFVPWLSMFPNQEGVKLKLLIKEIEGTRKASDIIKLSSKNGIKFVPDELKVSEANGKEITILCQSPLSNDTKINLLDKNDNTVGKINIVKNDIAFKLDIKFVKVCKERHLNQLKDKFDNHINKIEEFSKYNSLNQALIKPNIIEKDFNNIDFINLDELPDEMFGAGRISINSNGRQELKKIYPTNDFKGLVVFYLGVENTTSKGGDTQSYPLNDQYIYLYLNSVLNRDLPHEIGHALGLEHTFIEQESTLLSNLEKTLETYNKAVKEKEKYLNDPKYDQKNVLKVIDKGKDLIRSQKKKIKDCKSISLKNPHKFIEEKTTNMMDYVENPDDMVLDFQHWQWLVMQDEIKTYYN